MNKDIDINRTREYYEEHSEDFVERTEAATPDESYDGFLKSIPEGGFILDFGAGGGRDLRFFIERGYDALGVEYSKSLYDLMKERHLPAVHADMTDYISEKKADAVWCRAVIHHLSDEDIERFVSNLRYNLKKEGLVYLSFKKTGQDYIDEYGRLFRAIDIGVLKELFKRYGFKDFKEWESEDFLGRKDITWVNVSAVKMMIEDSET